MKSRISNLQVGCPQDLILLSVIDGGRDVESLLHDRFSDSRIRGEWFDPTDDLMEFIQSSASYEIFCEMRRSGKSERFIYDE